MSIQIDRYVVDTLMRDLVGHDRRPAAFMVFVAILTAANGRAIALSNQQLAYQTGLSKRAVQNATAHLAQRGLMRIERRGRTEPALFHPLKPWQR